MYKNWQLPSTKPLGGTKIVAMTNDRKSAVVGEYKDGDGEAYILDSFSLASCDLGEIKIWWSDIISWTFLPDEQTTEQHFVSKGMELSKRFRLEGVVIEDICPTCGEEISLDLRDDYLSYPQTGIPIERVLWCRLCDEKGIEAYITKNITVQIMVEVEELNERRLSK